MKRILSALLALLMLVGSLVACDSGAVPPVTTDPAQPSQGDVTDTEQTTTQDSSINETTAPTTTKDKVIVQPENEKSNAVMVNQLGYLTNSRKVAYVTGGGRTFEIVNATTGEIVYEGKIEKGGYESTSGDDVHFCDFSDFTTPGYYYLWVNREIFSYPFNIGDDVYDTLFDDMLKTIFYQRCGYELPDGYENPYMHEACHTSYRHLMSEKVKGNEVAYQKDLTGGWHDAGDFSVQGTSVSLTSAQLMYVYRMYPELCSDEVGIPESGNGVPDILDEARWGIEWLMKMQTEDGGVMRRTEAWGQPALTVRADKDTKPQYLYGVNYSDTGNMVAVCALASRIYKDIDADFANKCMEAANRGYAWLMANPDFKYEYVGNFYGATTEYQGASQYDELLWAKAEMYATTKDAKYLEDTEKLAATEALTGASYHDRGGMVIYSIITEGDGEWNSDALYSIKSATRQAAKQYAKYAQNNKWNVAANAEALKYDYNFTLILSRFSWSMLLAEKVESRVDYYDLASGIIDFALGANPLNISYTTGYGSNPVQYVHHRNSALGNMFPGIVVPGPGTYSIIINYGAHKELTSFLPSDTPLLKTFVDNIDYYRFCEWTIDASAVHLLVLAEMMHRNG